MLVRYHIGQTLNNKLLRVTSIAITYAMTFRNMARQPKGHKVVSTTALLANMLEI